MTATTHFGEAPAPALVSKSRPIADIIADLSRPIPPQYLKTKEKGKKVITFISWYTAVQLLERHAPGWSSRVKDVRQIGDNCVVVASITIPCAEGEVTREATGIEDDDHEGYGDPASNAEAMAFKRAAAKFGLGLYLYEKDRPQAPQRPPQPQQRPPQAPQPAAPDERQALLGRIMAILQEAGKTAKDFEPAIHKLTEGRTVKFGELTVEELRQMVAACERKKAAKVEATDIIDIWAGERWQCNSGQKAKCVELLKQYRDLAGEEAMREVVGAPTPSRLIQKEVVGLIADLTRKVGEAKAGS